jgi:hypothetical protein
LGVIFSYSPLPPSRAPEPIGGAGSGRIVLVAAPP